MLKKIGVILTAGLMAVAAMAPTLARAAAPAPEAGDAAAAFANALSLGNTTRAWQLLSAKSQKDTDVVQWSNAYAQQAMPTKPRAETLLRVLCSAVTPPTPGDLVVRAGEAYIEVKGVAPIARRIVVVKDPGGWRVDLAATDALNARAATEELVQLMREETVSRAGTGPRTSASANVMLDSLLAPQAKDYQAVETTPEGPDRATVVVRANVPVTVVVKATRLGPGWTVDLRNPFGPGDPLSPNALQEVASASERQPCEAQLTQLARALEAYCAKSDDRLPDPARWSEQIAPFLPPGTTLHCSADAVAGVSYAMNRNLAGLRRWEVANPGSVPVFFESTKHGRSPAEAGDAWPTTPRHVTGTGVLFLDGSVKYLTTAPSFAVTKVPPGTAPPRPARPGLGPMPPRVPGAGPLRPGPGRPMPPG